MNTFIKGFIVGAVALYIIMPLDAVPGGFDDLLVLIISVVTNAMADKKIEKKTVVNG